MNISACHKTSWPFTDPATGRQYEVIILGDGRAFLFDREGYLQSQRTTPDISLMRMAFDEKGKLQYVRRIMLTPPLVDKFRSAEPEEEELDSIAISLLHSLQAPFPSPVR